MRVRKPCVDFKLGMATGTGMGIGIAFQEISLLIFDELLIRLRIILRQGVEEFPEMGRLVLYRI